ncbi:MAG TPA: hypothetical protein VNN55_03855 [bacterium]|nr:hypothetical protein [bacterium]
MTFIIIAITIVIAVWVIWIASRTLSDQHTSSTLHRDVLRGQKTDEPSEDYDEPMPKAATPGIWILNPGSNFTLSVKCGSAEIATRLRLALDAAMDSGGELADITSIIAEHNVRCQEIDLYVQEYRPKYLARVAELSQSVVGWSDLSDADRRDVLAECSDKALLDLDVIPFADLKVLFENEPSDERLDDELLRTYGHEILRLYLSYYRSDGEAVRIPAQHHHRRRFEELVERNLAIRGSAIPTDKILSTFTLKSMNLIGEKCGLPRFTRKAKAIEALCSAPEIEKKLGETFALRELFLLKPLPDFGDPGKLEALEEGWEWSRAVAELLEHTYAMSKYATRPPAELREEAAFVAGWEIIPITGTPCRFCQQASGRKFGPRDYPKVPLHVGCRCTVSPLI